MEKRVGKAQDIINIIPFQVQFSQERPPSHARASKVLTDEAHGAGILIISIRRRLKLAEFRAHWGGEQLVHGASGREIIRQIDLEIHRLQLSFASLQGPHQRLQERRVVIALLDLELLDAIEMAGAENGKICTAIDIKFIPGREVPFLHG
jgi:hypothetical protein